MKQKFLLATLIAFALSMGAAAQSDSGVKQDTKDAAHSTGQAAKKTGHKVKKGTKKVVHKSAKATRKGAAKVEDKTDNTPK
jgi:phosphosulfolactate synthase (CoM biosynthesis protein A)